VNGTRTAARARPPRSDTAGTLGADGAKSAMPEPQGLALVAAALAAMGLRARRGRV
jgi:hypothetical protein